MDADSTPAPETALAMSTFDNLIRCVTHFSHLAYNKYSTEYFEEIPVVDFVALADVGVRVSILDPRQ